MFVEAKDEYGLAVVSLSEELRARTGPMRRAIEVTPYTSAVVGRKVTLRAYGAQLYGYKVVLESLDEALMRWRDVQGEAALFAACPSRLECLEEDIAAIDPDGFLAHGPTLDAARVLRATLERQGGTNKWSLLGYLYAAQSVTLVGRILNRHIVAALGLGPAGVSFFGGEHHDVIRRTHQFEWQLNQLTLCPGEREVVVAAALRGLSGFGDIHDEIASLLHPLHLQCARAF